MHLSDTSESNNLFNLNRVVSKFFWYPQTVVNHQSLTSVNKIILMLPKTFKGSPSVPRRNLLPKNV